MINKDRIKQLKIKPERVRAFVDSLNVQEEEFINELKNLKRSFIKWN